MIEVKMTVKISSTFMTNLGHLAFWDKIMHGDKDHE